MVTFPAGLPEHVKSAWLACEQTLKHLPPARESGDSTFLDSVVDFCLWARGRTLNEAERAVRGVDGLPEGSVALTLVKNSRELFRLCAPKTRQRRTITSWDLETFRPRTRLQLLPLPLTDEEYEDKVRTSLEGEGVRDRVRSLLDFDREGLLAQIEQELRQAARSTASQSAGPPVNDPDDERNRWLYEQFRDTPLGLKQIRQNLNRVAEERKWTPLGSEQAVHKAIERWCSRNDKEMPRRKPRRKPRR